MDREKDNIGQDNPGHFVLLKLQKLSAALYLITNVIHDSDPIKWRLRDTSLSLLSQTKSDHLLLGQLIPAISQVLSLIDIARLNASVSTMNFDILKQEYLAIRNKLEEQNRPEFLKQLAIPESGLEASNIVRQFSSSIATKSINHQSAPRLIANTRRDGILKLIKQQGPISIKDIAKSVPGVSSKTVQRELAELVRAGLLKKEGDRRWSRYSALS